jgi:hypothetical protein
MTIIRMHSRIEIAYFLEIIYFSNYVRLPIIGDQSSTFLVPGSSRAPKKLGFVVENLVLNIARL